MSSVPLDDELKRKLERRIAMPPINEANSRDGNSNLSMSDSRSMDAQAESIKKQEEAWLNVKENAVGVNLTSNKSAIKSPPSGGRSGSNSNPASSPTGVTGKIGKRGNNLETNRSPKLQRTNNNNHIPGGGNGVEAEEDTSSRGAQGMKPLNHYFGGASGVSSTKSDDNHPTAHNTLVSSTITTSSANVASFGQKKSFSLRNKDRSTVSTTTNYNQDNNNSFSSSFGSSSSSSLTAEELKRQLDKVMSEKLALTSKVARLENAVKQEQEAYKMYSDDLKNARGELESVHRAAAIKEGRRKRDRLAADNVRLGKIVTMRINATSMGDVWEEGYALKELQKRKAEQIKRKEALDERKKKLLADKRRISRLAQSSSAAVAAALTAEKEDGSSSSSSSSSTGNSSVFDLDFLAEDAAIRMHQDQLKKDGESLAEEKRVLEEEKAAHIREYKRCQNEDRSRFFRDLPCLNQRYLLLSLLGRGGFSEVWKAMDLIDLREVAVKVHQLNPNWSEERKSSYIKHVTREYDIHRSMKHSKVVRQFDVFEIDINSFATVLEYCRGTDLDEKLKRERVINEKDAKTIVMQILSGLRYLHHPETDCNNNSSSNNSNNNGVKRSAIIHYDLKPANILFDENGDVKITDFGLSKMIDDSQEGTSIELTSQGAGTYYYLPPECFERHNPRITPKVDVWSLGVIVYQMLCGRKPFGDGQSQERILADGVMLNADRNQITFPENIKLSEEAKGFVRACLTRDYRIRPDVNALCIDDFIKKK